MSKQVELQRALDARIFMRLRRERVRIKQIGDEKFEERRKGYTCIQPVACAMLEEGSVICGAAREVGSLLCPKHHSIYLQENGTTYSGGDLVASLDPDDLLEELAPFPLVDPPKPPPKLLVGGVRKKCVKVATICGFLRTRERHALLLTCKGTPLTKNDIPPISRSDLHTACWKSDLPGIRYVLGRGYNLLTPECLLYVVRHNNYATKNAEAVCECIDYLLRFVSEFPRGFIQNCVVEKRVFMHVVNKKLPMLYHEALHAAFNRRVDWYWLWLMENGVVDREKKEDPNAQSSSSVKPVINRKTLESCAMYSKFAHVEELLKKGIPVTSLATYFAMDVFKPLSEPREVRDEEKKMVLRLISEHRSDYPNASARVWVPRTREHMVWLRTNNLSMNMQQAWALALSYYVRNKKKSQEERMDFMKSLMEGGTPPDESIINQYIDRYANKVVSPRLLAALETYGGVYNLHTLQIAVSSCSLDVVQLILKRLLEMATQDTLNDLKSRVGCTKLYRRAFSRWCKWCRDDDRNRTDGMKILDLLHSSKAIGKPNPGIIMDVSSEVCLNEHFNFIERVEFMLKKRLDSVKSLRGWDKAGDDATIIDDMFAVQISSVDDVEVIMKRVTFLAKKKAVMTYVAIEKLARCQTAHSNFSEVVRTMRWMVSNGRMKIPKGVCMDLRRFHVYNMYNVIGANEVIEYLEDSLGYPTKNPSLIM